MKETSKELDLTMLAKLGQNQLKILENLNTLLKDLPLV